MINKRKLLITRPKKILFWYIQPRLLEFSANQVSCKRKHATHCGILSLFPKTWVLVADQLLHVNPYHTLHGRYHICIHRKNDSLMLYCSVLELTVLNKQTNKQAKEKTCQNT